jgi:hypothetical protein
MYMHTQTGQRLGEGEGLRKLDIFGGFAFSREFEKLENRLLQSALQATPSHFCRSKPTSPSQVKEVVVKDASHP